MINEMKQRVELIKWMDLNNIRDYREVSDLIAKYRGNPEGTIQTVKRLTI